ncbi:hypothetical protein [Megalodesulfovibrio paquesii]
MTPDDWNYVERTLSIPYGHVTLRCDGYLVGLRVEPVKKMQCGICVYVDGWMRGEWMSKECDVSTRFLRRSERSLYSKKEQAEWRKLSKALGKPASFDKKMVFYLPCWNSVTSLRRHYIKHNTSIELVREEV